MAVSDAKKRLPAATSATAGFSQSLERGLQILAVFSELRPVLGIADIARAVDLNKSTTLPLRRDAGAPRLPPAGPRNQEVLPRPACCRPRVRGDQLDGDHPGRRHVRSRRWPTRPGTRSAWRCSTAQTSSTSTAAAARAAPPWDGTESARRLAAAGLLHGDGESPAGVPRSGHPAGAARPNGPGPPRAEDDHRPRAS